MSSRKPRQARLELRVNCEDSPLLEELCDYLDVTDGVGTPGRYCVLIPPQGTRSELSIATLLLFLKQAARVYGESFSVDRIREYATAEWRTDIDDITWQRLLKISPWTMTVEPADIKEAMKKGGPFLWARTIWFSSENLATVEARVNSW